MDQIVELISNIGFPAAVSVYLLIRIESKLDELTKAFYELSKDVQIVAEHQKKK